MLRYSEEHGQRVALTVTRVAARAGVEGVSVSRLLPLIFVYN